MQIGRKDVVWNYGATFFQYGALVLLFPFILNKLSSETVAVWAIFNGVVAFISLLDFGFNSSFTRNTTYVFSGAKKLEATGFHIVNESSAEVDYGLLKGLISVMRFFYSRMALIIFISLSTIGTWYVHAMLQSYEGNRHEAYVSWIILCLINSYSFYTLYYDSLLFGKGQIMRLRQISIAGQLVYIIVAITLIMFGFGLIAIVSAQVLSVIIKRFFSYRLFYTRDIKLLLKNAVIKSQKDILKAIYPNAVKIGLTSVGGFLVSRAAMFIGSVYLSLETIASYVVTLQIIGIISGIAMVYFMTYQPQIMQYRVHNNNSEIKQLYLKSCMLLFIAYTIGGSGLIFFGDWALHLFGSKTLLLHKPLIMVALIISLLESNHSIAGCILMTRNEVPFFKAAIFAGGLTVVLLYVFKYIDLGVLGMLLAPGIAQGCYQNWHWPTVVIKELDVRKNDILQIGLYYPKKLNRFYKIHNF
jgi:O-antigen/teichoic acid export membrane protein